MTQHRHNGTAPAYRRHRWSTTRTVFTSIMAGLVIMSTLGISTPSQPEIVASFIAGNVQTFAPVASSEIVPAAVRHNFSATPGYKTFIEGGTNHDWAKLVLLMGDFPVTESNVTVVTRWMRQENYVDTWYNRNNPLNNGWGSGGGGGTGSYVDLVDAAANAAEALNTLGRYSEIVATLRASAPAEQVERAIWFSGWAAGMYKNGQHWAYNPVPVVTAPPSAWGR